MRIKNSVLAGASAVLLLAGMLGSAEAGLCTTDTVGAYTTGGFSCDVGTLTFSNFSVTTTGLVTLGDFSPIVLLGTTTPNGQIETGFQLNYSANTSGIDTNADVTIHYDVMAQVGAPLIDDAFMSLTGGTGGDGARITLSETLSPNNVSLFLPGSGVTDVTFDPIAELFAIKDQNDFAGLTFATSSAVIDAFSQCTPGTPGCVVNPPVTVPEPGSLVLMGTFLVALGGVGWFMRRNAGGGFAA